MRRIFIFLGCFGVGNTIGLAQKVAKLGGSAEITNYIILCAIYAFSAGVALTYAYAAYRFKRLPKKTVDKTPSTK